MVVVLFAVAEEVAMEDLNQSLVLGIDSRWLPVKLGGLDFNFLREDTPTPGNVPAITILA